MPELQGDSATLAALSPTPAKELHYLEFKNRLRLHGSQYMTLKRPSRLAEFGREYVPGDPVNLIDWKAYARTDQLIIREVRDESVAYIAIALDLSPTMHWPNAEVPVPGVPTKAEIAWRVALHLSYMHLRMGDQVELALLTEAAAVAPTQVVKLRRAAAVIDLYEGLRAASFATEAVSSQLRPAPAQPAVCDTAFWLGDGLGPGAVAAFLQRGRRSFFLHTLSSLELSTDWLADGTSYFDQDLTLREYQGQALKQRAFYLEQLHAWCEQWRQEQRQRRGEYLTLSDKTPIHSYQGVLQGFIKAAGKA